MQQLEAQLLSLPGAVRPAARGTFADAKASVWAAAFRKRWGGRHGRLKCGEHLPTEEMLAKAGEDRCPVIRLCACQPGRSAGRNLVPLFGPIFAPAHPAKGLPAFLCFRQKLYV